MIEQLQDAQQRRCAIKSFEPGKAIAPSQIDALIEAARLSPSSFNSQPWHLVAVSNPDEKRRLAKATMKMNQAKIEQCSHLFIFCAKKEFGSKELVELEQFAAHVKNTELNDNRLAAIGHYVEEMTPQEHQTWIHNQVHIQFGQFLLACAMLSIDACPMGGFYPEELDRALGLPERGLTSVALAAIGHRNPEDPQNSAIKVRYPRERILTEIL